MPAYKLKYFFLQTEIMKKRKNKFLSINEELGLPKKVMFGDEEIELDESMFYGKEYLCPECRELGYCKKNKPAVPRKKRSFKLKNVIQLNLKFLD